MSVRAAVAACCLSAAGVSAFLAAGRAGEAPKSNHGWNDSRLAGTGGRELPMATEQVFPGLKFQTPVTIMSVPVNDPSAPERLLVVELAGVVSTFLNHTEARKVDVLLDLRPRFSSSVQAYGLAFHPRFPDVPYVYVVYNHPRPKPAENVLSRFTLTQFDPPRADPASEREMMRWRSDGHNGGDVKFGPDGFLYVSTGDGSVPGDPQNVGQRVDIVTGGILRIDVDHPAPGKNYAVPADNPFVGIAHVLPEYWAYGLRNPWRMSFAPTGELWVGDNGDDSWESVHLIRKGHNYGWSTFEGTHPFKRTLPLGGPNPHATPPVVELAHSEARSVSGGLVYRGKTFPALAGYYLFGDYVTGFLWAFRWDGGSPGDFHRIADMRGSPIGFGEDRAHEVLSVRGDGQIHRLVGGAPPAKSRELPKWLSETGLFASTRDLTPTAGVVRYEINAPMWSDGAVALHFLAVSAKQPIAFREKENWHLPDGSALVRTLQIPRALGMSRVETQVMHRENGTWEFFTYAWNAAQTDAELIAATGEIREAPGLRGRRWNFASRSECMVCHTAQTDFVLGVSTGQLNRDSGEQTLDGSSPANQIQALIRRGLLKGRSASLSVDGLPRTVNPLDPAAPIEARVRAYLHVNCAHCHRPGGVGGRAQFQLMESLPLEKTGLINGQTLVPLLGQDGRLVTPGDPRRSEVLHRLSLKEGGRMPLLGSQQTDDAGVALIREWIMQLKP